MRHRSIRVASLLALLAGVVLAVSPGPVAVAQTGEDGHQGSLRDFWNQQANWLDQATRKALRATQQPETWEVLVDSGNDGEWDHQGFMAEVYSRRPEPPTSPDQALKETLDSFGMVILIGEVRAAKGSHLYVVVAVLDQDSAFQDSDGVALKPFVPLHVNETYQGALRFAREYEKVYNGGSGNGERLDPANLTPGLLGDFRKVAPACESVCSIVRNGYYSVCNAIFSSSLASASSARNSCVSSCGGSQSCVNNCFALYFQAQAICTEGFILCTGVADEKYRQCINACSGSGGGGGGCLATATQTTTAALPLGDTSVGSGKLTPAPINFALVRSESRGEESFIMDEWAIVQEGRIRISSNPAFGLAATDQKAAPPKGLFLVIQEPIHEMNSRYVPKPEVRISNTSLAPSERGAGEVVAARLELSPSGIVDRAEIVYTSRPMDDSRLEKLVSRRVGLLFASQKGHRTAVYVSFRLTDRFEVLGALAVFPKCCCSGVHCV